MLWYCLKSQRLKADESSDITFGALELGMHLIFSWFQHWFHTSAYKNWIARVGVNSNLNLLVEKMLKPAFHMNFILGCFSNSFFPHFDILFFLFDSFVFVILIPFFHCFNILSRSFWIPCWMTLTQLWNKNSYELRWVIRFDPVNCAKEGSSRDQCGSEISFDPIQRSTFFDDKVS